MRHTSVAVAGLALALAAPGLATSAWADDRSEIEQLKRDLREMKTSYEARLQALEDRLRAAEAAHSAGTTPATTATAGGDGAVPDVAAASAPVSSGASVGGSGGANAFNPAISLILSGQYVQARRDPAAYAITGYAVPAGTQVGVGQRGFSLSESELGLSAAVDPWWRGSINVALHPDDTVSVEEGYVQTTALSHGLSLKAGRFFSGVGYLNEQHAHTWDFADAPLVYQAFLGGQHNDDGVQLRWLAPTDQFVELGAELGRGANFPGSETDRNGTGMRTLFAHTGGDVGDSHSWRAGLSWMEFVPQGQSFDLIDAMGGPFTRSFDGRTRLWVIDGVWKWAPGGNATRQNFKLQAEWLHRAQDGSLTDTVGGSATRYAYRSASSGWYAQGAWQFMPTWRAGLRFDALRPDSVDDGLNGSVAGGSVFKPQRASAMLDYSPSEFSRWRLQFTEDRSQYQLADRQWVVQYQMSLGAHGAHSY